jgi:plastocyanin
MTSVALRKLTLAVAIGIVAVFAACGGDDSTAPPTNGPFTGTVQVKNNFFSPASATVKVGEKVTWQFNGSSHSVTSTGASDFAFDSGVKSSGTFEFTFTTEGVARYFCTVHGSSMSGTITVKP